MSSRRPNLLFYTKNVKSRSFKRPLKPLFVIVPSCSQGGAGAKLLVLNIYEIDDNVYDKEQGRVGDAKSYVVDNFVPWSSSFTILH